MCKLGPQNRRVKVAARDVEVLNNSKIGIGRRLASEGAETIGAHRSCISNDANSALLNSKMMYCK